jgi:hypothetical protein
MHVERVASVAGHDVPSVGTRWVAGLVASLVERQAPASVVMLNTGAARDVADQIEKAGVEVMSVSGADWSAASVRYRDELAAGTWVHRLGPELAQAASAADWRNGWTAGPGGPVSAWTSGTLAGWGFDHAPAPAGKFWMG